MVRRSYRGPAGATARLRFHPPGGNESVACATHCAKRPLFTHEALFFWFLPPPCVQCRANTCPANEKSVHTSDGRSLTGTSLAAETTLRPGRLQIGRRMQSRPTFRNNNLHRAF